MDELCPDYIQDTHDMFSFLNLTFIVLMIFACFQMSCSAYGRKV